MANKGKPHTPSERFHQKTPSEVTTGKRPEKRLTTHNHRKKGRNSYGRITSRRRGGGHKRILRTIDFKRNDKFDIPAKIQEIEYDPNRSANIALIAYADGEKRYILAPDGLTVGDVVVNATADVEDYNVGVSIKLRFVPPATPVHCIELEPLKGAQVGRSAGVAARMVSFDGEQVTLKMPSGELRYFHGDCRATIGAVGNKSHSRRKLGKAGRNRWLGRKPRVRGVAMNPVDHPMGGGEGRTSGGGHPQSPWGQLSKGFPTRKKSKPSNSRIITNRLGKKFKKK